MNELSLLIYYYSYTPDFTSGKSKVIKSVLRKHLFKCCNEVTVFLQVLSCDLEGTNLIQRIQTLFHILRRIQNMQSVK